MTAEFVEKPEKLSSALYLITSFFDDHEPLKWKLRTLASDLVSLSVFIKDNIFRDRENMALKVRAVVLETLGLLVVAKNVGLISDANHILLKNELQRYLELLSLPTGISDENGGLALASNFFEQRANYSENLTRQTPILLKDNISDRNLPVPQRTSNFTPQYQPQDNSEKLKEFGAVSVKKNNRQSIIISVLKRKKEATIKDITPLITGCSEKTVQRELSLMVEQGILTKIGEKRWSKYSLARA